MDLRGLVEEHWRQTGSVRASAMLKSWEHSLAGFRQITPIVSVPLAH
jgi:glutamate synthase domain-containing protein 3